MAEHPIFEQDNTGPSTPLSAAGFGEVATTRNDPVPSCPGPCPPSPRRFRHCDEIGSGLWVLRLGKTGGQAGLRRGRVAPQPTRCCRLAASTGLTHRIIPVADGSAVSSRSPPEQQRSAPRNSVCGARWCSGSYPPGRPADEPDGPPLSPSKARASQGTAFRHSDEIGHHPLLQRVTAENH